MESHDVYDCLVSHEIVGYFCEHGFIFNFALRSIFRDGVFLVFLLRLSPPLMSTGGTADAGEGGRGTILLCGAWRVARAKSSNI